MLGTRTHRLAAGILMVAGLSLVAAPLAAAAHTGKLFTWAYEPIDQETFLAGFATISPTDASMTLLGGEINPPLAATGAEICNENAWAVGINDDDVDNDVAFTWDHNTGALGAPIDLTADITDFKDTVIAVEVSEAYSADSLTDCTELAYVDYSAETEEGDESVLTLAYVDPATGATTPIFPLFETLGGEDVRWRGIATNPVTSVTYLFARIDGSPFVAVFDFATTSLLSLDEMDGPQDFFESGGFVFEADFEPSGVLWVTYAVNNFEAYHLLSFAAGADLATALPVDSGEIIQCGEGVCTDDPDVLTYDPTALANTGSTPLGALVVGGLLFAAGSALLAVRSRRPRTA